MKKQITIIGITLVVTIVIATCLILYTGEKQGIGNKEKILDRFDGYNWSWRCFNVELVTFTLWKEHITNIEKIGDYWLIEGFSSDRNDLTKNISSDESGKILIIYDFEDDEITDWLHGGEIPLSPEVDKEGKITNPTGLVYC